MHNTDLDSRRTNPAGDGGFERYARSLLAFGIPSSADVAELDEHHRRAADTLWGQVRDDLLGGRPADDFVGSVGAVLSRVVGHAAGATGDAWLVVVETGDDRVVAFAAADREPMVVRGRAPGEGGHTVRALAAVGGDRRRPLVGAELGPLLELLGTDAADVVGAGPFQAGAVVGFGAGDVGGVGDLCASDGDLGSGEDDGSGEGRSGCAGGAVPFGIVAALCSEQRDGFGRAEAAFAGLLAQRVALALAAALLLDSLRSELRERSETEALITDQADILEGIVRGLPLTETLASVCTMFEERAPLARSAILSVEGSDGALRLAVAPHLGSEAVELMEVAALASDQVSWARAASANSIILTEDLLDLLDETPLRRWREVTVADKLRACLAAPLQSSNGATLGVFVAFWPQVGVPPVKPQLLETATALAAVAIERAEHETTLAEAATHDHLTGLPNRALFFDRLTQALARTGRSGGLVAVLFLDLDRFKAVNDALGHAAGDRLIVAAAKRLLGAVRPGDTVARFGGDEFAVLCEDVVDGESARELAVRLAAAVRGPFSLSRRRYEVSASIGIALGGAGQPADELVRDADLAMYRAKERGRDRVEIFDARLRERTRRLLQTEDELRAVLANHEVVVHYQPMVDLTHGRIAGVEAILGLPRRRGRGAVLETIHLAQELGLVEELSAQMAASLGATVAGWRDDGLVDGSFRIAFDVPTSQLDLSYLLDNVLPGLTSNGVALTQVTMEVTEASLLAEETGNLATLEGLRDLGIDLAIDDFGTGSSSLVALESLPVAALKVGRAFVGRVADDPRRAEILAGVVRFAVAMGMEVRAQGVESAAQLDKLRDMGVRWVQGPLFSSPGARAAGSGVTARAAGSGVEARAAGSGVEARAAGSGVTAPGEVRSLLVARPRW